VRILLLSLIAACYAPVIPEGTVCNSPDSCPSGLRCLDGTCQRGEAIDAPSEDGAVSDAADAMTPDAPVAIDAPMGCSPAGFQCPGGYMLNSCSGMCFIRCASPTTRDDARARCQAWGGTLASLDTTAANACANKADTPYSWIGLEQGPAVSPSTNWTWSSGVPFTFTAWGANEPNDGDTVENGTQNCGVATSGAWDDLECNDSLGFICRR